MGTAVVLTPSAKGVVFGNEYSLNGNMGDLNNILSHSEAPK